MQRVFFLLSLCACATDTFVATGSDAAAESGPSCGMTSCAAGETCCVSQASAVQCLPTCPAGAVTLDCSTSADCPTGQVCCIDQNNGVTAASCQSACGSNAVQLCNPAADAGCPVQAPCSYSNITDWGLPQSFGTCGGRGVP